MNDETHAFYDPDAGAHDEPGGNSCGRWGKADLQRSDISNYVTLNMFAVADAPLNSQKAEEYYKALNDYLKEKLNCGINYVYAAGNDYTNNYMLAMASGEKYDLVHAANWLGYTT